MSDDFEQQEYFTVHEAINNFDQRLLTIKGWGVTLSLVAFGLGFQYRAYGFFLVAAASSLAFWAIEAATKRHQMRHYVRIREIEVNRYLRSPDEEKKYSVPRIYWSWVLAQAIYKGVSPHRLEKVEPLRLRRGYRFSFMFPHVALPHAITLLLGLILFILGLYSKLSGFSLGAASK
jgi:hypothetical protein